MLSVSRKLLVALNGLNWLIAAVFVGLFIFFSTGPAGLVAGLARYGSDSPAMLHAILIALLLGAVAAVPVHVIFTRLIAILDTVSLQRPFVGINAHRLRAIAWALLAIQLLDLGFGLAARLSPADDFGWMPSLGGWLAVLMLFVLAHVFRLGTEMQDDVEATI